MTGCHAGGRRLDGCDAKRRLGSCRQQTDRIELPRRRQPLSERRPSILSGAARHSNAARYWACEHGLGRHCAVHPVRSWLVRIAPNGHRDGPASLLPLLRAVPNLGTVRNGWTDAWPTGHEVEIDHGAGLRRSVHPG